MKYFKLCPQVKIQYLDQYHFSIWINSLKPSISKEAFAFEGNNQSNNDKINIKVFYSLYRNKYSNLKLAEAIMVSRLGSSEEDW
jgi:hypothetical protein